MTHTAESDAAQAYRKVAIGRAERVEELMAELDLLRGAIRDLLPDECLVSRTTEVHCTDFVGGAFSNGATFTEDACCLPCRIRKVLDTRVPPPEV